MFGSIHTHFESLYDTANNLESMLKSFESLGAKRVAVTEHGEFTSFEDLKDLCSDMDIKVIPGVEGYFTEERYHLILIAKNEEGYKELSEIISDSNYNHNEKDQPIISWEILKNRVTAGNIICTTACIQGPLGHIFVDNEKEKDRKKDRYIKRQQNYINDKDRIYSLEEEYNSLKNKERKELSEDKTTEYKANHKKYLTISRNEKKLASIDEDFSDPLSIEEQIDTARDTYLNLVDIFGRENVYLEIQNHGIDKEQEVYPGILNFARVMGCTDKLICSNDIHIGATKDEITNDDTPFLRRQIAKFRRFNTYTPYEDWEKELYIKDDDELRDTLQTLPGIKQEEINIAISNVSNVLSSCELEYLYSKDKKQDEHYPKFCENENEMFDSLIEQGIKIKFPNGFPDNSYKERLAKEKRIIKDMGYAGYHLIVQDYLDYARNLGYLPKDKIKDAPLDLNELKEMTKIYPHNALNIGPGRGSGAGSLACYLLGITDIDPMQYNLLFERFLNPERVSMPDIDSDFRTDIRDKCIEYCANKYGKNGGTCKIITKSYGRIKGNLRLAARFYGMKDIHDAKIEKITDDVVNKYTKPYYKLADNLSKSVDDNISDIPEDILSNLDEKSLLIYDTAKKMDGIFMQYGQHAAGTIISGDKLESIIPLKWNKDKENYETQCTMAQAEAKGLLKMDFLGLENLDILTELMRKTDDTIILDYGRRNELLNNKEVLNDIFSKALTQGIFQLESDGMKKMLSEFKPDTFEDLILLIAAYRPGPMQYLPEIIATKKYQDGRSKEKPVPKINIDNKDLKDILSPTYGCIIYQEQVMMICQKLAGFTMGHADNVRKYMSKKKLEPLQHEREDFVKGCKEISNISEDDSNKLFDQMLDFASYAFNKSHATVYALIAFFTAYYKKYYPAEFFSVSLNHIDKVEEISTYRSEMSNFGVKLLSPTLGKSKSEFSNIGNTIYFGYHGIKGMSDIDLVCGDTLEDTIIRNKQCNITSKTMSKLAKLGLFNQFGSKEECTSFIEKYADNIVNKINVEKELNTLLKAEKADNRKISGKRRTLANIGRIPSFEQFKDEFVLTDKIEDLEVEMCGTKFLSLDEEKYLRKFGSFKELTDSPTQKGFYLVSCDEKEKRFSNGKPYHIAYIMDSCYEIRKMFLPEYIKPGLYTGPISDNIFCLMNSLEHFRSDVKSVKINIEKRLDIHPKSDMGKTVVLNSFVSILRREANRGSYTVIYNGGTKLGTLSKEGELALKRELLDRNIKFEKDYSR